MSRTYYQYVALPRRRHPAVTAYRAEESNGVITIHLGVSFCHSKDQFNRTLGRQIAEGRMNSAPKIISFERDDRPFHIHIASKVSSYIRNYGGLVTSSLTSNLVRRNEESNVVVYTVPASFISITNDSVGW